MKLQLAQGLQVSTVPYKTALKLGLRDGAPNVKKCLFATTFKYRSLFF